MKNVQVVQRGFTLVELLVVIAIIGVLVAMLLPSLGQARLQAKKVLCASQERQVAVGRTAYAQDNKYWYPDTNYYMPEVPRTIFLP